MIYVLSIFALILLVWLEHIKIVELAEGIFEHPLNNEIIHTLCTGTQKLYFVQTLCFVLFLNLLKTDYREPMLSVRYKQNLFFSVITKGIIIGFVYSTYVFLVYIIITFSSGNNIVFDFYAEYIKLFLFCLYCYFSYQIVYFSFKNFYISTICVLLCNFLVLCFAISANYYGINSNLYSMLGSISFLLPLNLITLYILYLLTRKKDNL